MILAGQVGENTAPVSTAETPKERCGTGTASPQRKYGMENAGPVTENGRGGHNICGVREFPEL